MDYKHATIKQYHKEGRALRTETTINNTRDFGIGKRPTNLPALREIGFSANRGLLHVQQRGRRPTQPRPSQMTYDLRRLKWRGLIARIEGSHRYRVTDYGLDTGCHHLRNTNQHNPNRTDHEPDPYNRNLTQ